VNGDAQSQLRLRYPIPVEPRERGRQLVNEVIYDPRLGLAVRKQRQFAVTSIIPLPGRTDQACRCGRLIEDDGEPSLFVELQDIVP